jgi:hypothetical protein
MCCQVEVSAADRSLVQRRPTEYDVAECDLETSIMRMPRPTRGCRAMQQLLFHIFTGMHSQSFVATFPTSELLCTTRSTMISRSTFILKPKIHRGCNFSNFCFEFTTFLPRAVHTLHCNIFPSGL